MSQAKKFSFLVIYALLPLPIIGLWLGGWYTFMPFVILYAGIPLVDAFITDSVNPDPSIEKQLAKERFFRYVTYCFVPIQYLMIAYGVHVVSTQVLTWYEWIGFAASTGLISGGVGINLAHEMMHKNSKLQHALSKCLLSSVCYGHFFIEHVKGHHVNVATPLDPATAQFGESLYHFIPKTLIGSVRSAYRLEKRRLANKGYKPYGFHNQFWWIITAPLVIAALCFAYGGLSGLAFFFAQSAMAVLTLEVVNYIEHYGLERQKMANGLYEKVTPYHSWNANHWLSNILLFHLQRHSDHHTYGGRPYQILRHMEDSPQLPSGYLGMMVLAAIPPLWRAVMDKRVLAYREKLAQEMAKEKARKHIHSSDALPV